MEILSYCKRLEYSPQDLLAKPKFKRRVEDLNAESEISSARSEISMKVNKSQRKVINLNAG